MPVSCTIDLIVYIGFQQPLHLNFFFLAAVSAKNGNLAFFFVFDIDGLKYSHGSNLVYYGPFPRECWLYELTEQILTS